MADSCRGVRPHVPAARGQTLDPEGHKPPSFQSFLGGVFQRRSYEQPANYSRVQEDWITTIHNCQLGLLAQSLSLRASALQRPVTAEQRHPCALCRGEFFLGIAHASSLCPAAEMVPASHIPFLHTSSSPTVRPCANYNMMPAWIAGCMNACPILGTSR